jgi:hypothetical protein
VLDEGMAGRWRNQSDAVAGEPTLVQPHHDR